MSDYPDVVAKIVADYMDRLRRQLRLVPAPERDQFLSEIQSHVYEAYKDAGGDDDVARILAVLRNLGEPFEVVSDRLPQTMVSSGRKRNLPLLIAGGILIALFGIPLGFGGAAVLAGVLAALGGIVVAFYATTAAVLLVGAFFMLLGLIRLQEPELWDGLIAVGFIQMDRTVAEFLSYLSPTGQGFLMITLATAFVAAGLGMLWLGRHVVCGWRFLSSLVFDWLRQAAQRVRRFARQQNNDVMATVRALYGRASFPKTARL